METTGNCVKGTSDHLCIPLSFHLLYLVTRKGRILWLGRAVLTSSWLLLFLENLINLSNIFNPSMGLPSDLTPHPQIHLTGRSLPFAADDLAEPSPLRNTNLNTA